jgi:hypothetical protein
MTIAAAFLTHEGVVFGADSTTTFTFRNLNPPLEKFYNNAQKVFEIGPPGGARFGLTIWGDGTFGELAHRTVVARLTDKLRPDTRLKDLVAELVHLSREPEAGAGRSMIGYLIGGVASGSRLPECTRVVFGKADEEPKVEELLMHTAYFQGAPRFFSRLHRGYDPELKPLLADEMAKSLSGVGTQGADIAGAVTHCLNVFDAAAARLPPMHVEGVPLRDAIDFLHSYLYATVKAHKFLVGAPICGGAVEIGFVTADRPFRWVRHKPFDAAIMDDQ